MLGTRKRDVDPIDTLDVVSGLSELLDCIKNAHLEEADRGLAFFKRARISDQGNNDDFCFLSLECVHCTDTNLHVPPKKDISTMSSQNSMVLPTCLET